jgi:hypothetical protein
MQTLPYDLHPLLDAISLINTGALSKALEAIREPGRYEARIRQLNWLGERLIAAIREIKQVLPCKTL